jgi:biotin carboxylase
MSKHTILIVGTSFSTLRSYLEDHGYDYIVLKDVRLTKYPDKKFKRRVVCDFSSKDIILQTVDAIAAKKPISGVIATYEDYILPAAEIAAHLGLPGLPLEAAKACTDKFLMRQKFSEAPEKISPDFSVVHSEQDVQNFAASHNFPLILKPANLSKSLLVTKNHSMEELLANYSSTMEKIGAVYKKYAPNREPKLLVEEFLEGSVHSVDAFVDTNGEPHVLEQVVDYQTGYDIGFNDNFHYSRILPSQLSPDEQAALRHCAGVGIQALGIKNSPAHVEVIMTKEGPRIVEIGARNGGYRERMHRLANGIDITGNALKLVLGQTPEITARRNEPVAVLELFPKTPGNFAGIAHEEELRQLPSLTYLSIKKKPGEYVGKSSDGFKMCAVVILHHADSEQFHRDLTFVNEHVRVVTK